MADVVARQKFIHTIHIHTLFFKRIAKLK